jgi:hypothetical protein
MDGASVIEDTWLRARAGEHGYLSGRDAEAIACDALIVPLVTGSPDWALISEMTTLVTDAYNHASAKDGTPWRRRRGRPCSTPWPDWRSSSSGPGALASALRRSLLDAPPNGKSVILDIGCSDTIPKSIRKAVIASGKGCAWPGGRNRRPATCDVHT